MCHMLHARYRRILFLPASLPACLLAAYIRTFTNEGDVTVFIYRYVVVFVVVVYRFAIAAVCLDTPTCCERMGEVYVNIVIVSRVYACVLKSGEQNSIEMYRITTKLRKLRFSLRETAINFSQPGVVSPTPFIPRLSSSSSYSRGQDLPLKSSYSSMRKKTPKGTERY